MRNREMILIAIFIILAGVLLLIGNLFNISIWAYCFPIGLILLGLLVLLRPRMTDPGTQSHVVLIGNLDRSGLWTMTDEEYFSFIIDADYDLTKADIPLGETTLRGFSFISDISIFAPEDLGVAIVASSFVTEFKLDGAKGETYFLAPFHWQSDNYKLADRRVRIELTQFIGDIKLRRF
ncbi:MAG: LiaF-related protein [Chloroflexota bacterium]|jgi:hypothetical protein